MKKFTSFYFFFVVSLIFAQQQNVTFSVSPTTFKENDNITITVSNVNLSSWGVTDIYLWAWSYDLNGLNSIDAPNNGTWDNSESSSTPQKLTSNGDGTYSITFTPTTFYNRTGIGKIGFLVKAKDGTGDKKSQNKLITINALTLISPSTDTSVLNSGDSFQITAKTSFASNFVLKANGSIINSSTSSALTYSVSKAITENTTFILDATNNGETLSKTFKVIIRPVVTQASVPNGMKDGINFDPSDNTKATLVLYAPDKNFIYVIGDFNNWKIDDAYLLKKDVAKDRFWIKLSGLTPQTNHMYQYLIDGTLRVADPYSTTVLTESNDQYINATTYPNLPAYPTGKTNYSVTLLRTGDAPFNWQTTNFIKPAKTDLVIYELLVRDFDKLHSFDAVKTHLDYLQTLGINAIELMPISEFDGNESWGYSPSFHMALDKYYGTPTALKQLIDECHSRGIAVILDVVYNHATGQNPYYRMWNTDNGGYGGKASSDSPFFNQEATHSYGFFNDFNHSKQATKDYVKRTVQYWIDEYKIDGMRWDFTKGFTQNCSSNDTNCTNALQRDRINVLEEYADYQWEKDPNFYVIFENLGQNSEETEWVNYKLDEGKGIMLWSNLNSTYNEATQGYNEDGKSDFSWINYKNRGWSVPANVSYMESHDEERLMYKNLKYGNSNASGSYSIKNLSTALDREKLAGVFYFTIPGPKMIWQFGELGYDFSINYNGRTGNKPIHWDYFDVANRKSVYDTWASLIHLKKEYEVFKTNTFTLDVGNSNGLKSIHLTDDTTNSNLKHVTIIGNFGVTPQSINPKFQQTGTWYDLLDSNSSISVSNVNDMITLQPGEFKIYGDYQISLAVKNYSQKNKFIIYPNPVENEFQIDKKSTQVQIFDSVGRKIAEFKGNFNANKKFNISSVKRGFYFVKVKDKKEISTQKIIKK